jgi:hypothetical protein
MYAIVVCLQLEFSGTDGGLSLCLLLAVLATCCAACMLQGGHCSGGQVRRGLDGLQAPHKQQRQQ